MKICISTYEVGSKRREKVYNLDYVEGCATISHTRGNPSELVDALLEELSPPRELSAQNPVNLSFVWARYTAQGVIRKEVSEEDKKAVTEAFMQRGIRLIVA